MLHIQLITIGFTLTALAISGCGGSSKTGTTTTEASTATTASATTTATTTPTVTTVQVATGKPLTNTALIAKADAICARTNKKLLAISVKTQNDFVRVLPQVAIYNRAESGDLSKLVPPASLQSDWTKLINSAHIYSEDVKQIASEAQTSGYASAVPLLQTAQGVRKQMRTVAARDGFKHCAEIG